MQFSKRLLFAAPLGPQMQHAARQNPNLSLNVRFKEIVAWKVALGKRHCEITNYTFKNDRMNQIQFTNVEFI